MIFGNKMLFAVQVDIIEETEDDTYCHFCYWINGLKIGDDSIPTLLNDILIFYPWIINDVGNRAYDSKLSGVEPKDVFASISSRIYNDETELFIGNPARFDILIKTESMFGIDVFYFEDEKQGYILYQHNDIISSFELQKNYVDNVFIKSYHTLVDLKKQLETTK